MFRTQPELLKDVLQPYIREQGLETPLLQKRLIDSIPQVLGSHIAALIENPYIKNQTLFMHVKMPALRADLSMARAKFAKKLNEAVSADIITDIKFL